MSEKIYDVPAQWQSRAFVNDAKYKQMYAASLEDPGKFWAEQAKRITWSKPFTKVKNTSFAPGNISIKWFEDGNSMPASTASIATWKNVVIKPRLSGKAMTRRTMRRSPTGNACGGEQIRQRSKSRGQERRPCYHLSADDRRGGLRDFGVRTHWRDSFGYFRRLLADSIAGRVDDCKSTIIVTADEGIRGGRKIPLKANVDAACEKVSGVKTVVVVRHTKAAVNMMAGRDVYYDDVAKTYRPIVRARKWTRRTRFSFFTPRARPASRRVFCATGGYLLFASITHGRVRLSRW